MKKIYISVLFFLIFNSTRAQYVLTAIGSGVHNNGSFKYSVCQPWGMLSVDPICANCSYQFEYVDQSGNVNIIPSSAGNSTINFWQGTGTYHCVVFNGSSSVTTNDVFIFLTDSTGSLYPYPNSYQRLSVVSTFCNQVNLKANFQQYLGYKWLRNDTIIPGATSSFYSASVSGNYTCHLYNSCGWTYSDTLHVTVPSTFAKPVITAPGGSFTNCQGASILLTTPAVTGAHYRWIVNGTYSSQIGDTNQVKSFIPNGNVKVVVSNACKSDTSLAVTTSMFNNPLPTGLISVSSSAPYCGNVTLKAAYNIFYKYQWTKNGNPISGKNDSAITVYSSGNYSCIVKNLCGDSLIYPLVPITIIAKPTSIISTLSNTTVCNGTSVLLTASTGNGYSWQWMKGTTNISNAITNSYAATTTGWYKVVITNSNGCSKTSNSINVTIQSNPAATVTASGPLIFCAGDSVVLTANAGTGYTYQWKKNSSANVVSLNQIYTATTAGSYWVQVSNSFGCTKNSTLKVIVIPCREGNELVENNILIYPNPSNNYFEVHSNGLQTSTMQVTDITGRIIERSRTINSDEKIGENWSIGVYFLRLSEGKQTRIIKLVKSNQFE